MKKYNFLFIIILGLALSNCGNEKKGENTIFSFDTAKIKSQYNLDESIELNFLNIDNHTVDSVVYFNNDLKIGTEKSLKKFIFDCKNQKLGNQNLKATIYYDNEFAEATTTIELVSNITPKLLQYKIVNTYPHDIEAYTQGLEFHRDTLYEGTGNGEGRGTGKKGISSLRKTDFKTGKSHKKLELESKIFGEGITILNNKVYQLTYKNNEAYVYDANTFRQEKTFAYPKPMEGWGLTNDGKYLYMTDSSEVIHIIDPNTFKEVDALKVYSLALKVPAINELEWVDGKIYGNVYQKDAIAVINPKTGAVEGILNLIDLKNKVSKLPDTDVLNGIAYNKKNKTFFVTGKNWDKMFEIKITN